MPPERNDPCPCGSGLKYKKCCLAAASIGTGAGVDSAWSLRRLQGPLEEQILAFGRSRMGGVGLDAAIHQFSFGEDTVRLEANEEQFFLPWLLYTYQAFGGAGDRDEGQPWERTIAGAFLSRRRHAIGTRERTFIRSCVVAPYSFFDVLRSDPGVGMRLRDILLESEHEIVERSGSRTLRPGDILYGQVVPIEGFALLVGTGSIVLPAMAKERILALRKSLRERHGLITPGLLGQLEQQLRKMYFEARDRALNPSPPALANTDGEPLELHEIDYEIQDPERAFQALRTLAVGVSEKKLRAGASAGKDGTIRKVEIPWLKRGPVGRGGGRTVLGNLGIRGRKLKVEVNSANRARRIRAIIERRLAGEASYVKTRARSAQHLLGQPAGRTRESADRAARDHDTLMEIPEIRARTKELVEAHYEDWPDHPLPALGGKTPRQAVADPEGREMVEALLTDFERAEDERHPREPRYDFSALRRRLGIAPRRG